MLSKKDLNKFNLTGVALCVIILGAAIFAFGAAGWFINFLASANIAIMPSMKIMGGAVLIALGYIQLEIELLRHK